MKTAASAKLESNHKPAGDKPRFSAKMTAFASTGIACPLAWGFLINAFGGVSPSAQLPWTFPTFCWRLPFCCSLPFAQGVEVLHLWDFRSGCRRVRRARRAAARTHIYRNPLDSAPISPPWPYTHAFLAGLYLSGERSMRSSIYAMR